MKKENPRQDIQEHIGNKQGRQLHVSTDDELQVAERIGKQQGKRDPSSTADELQVQANVVNNGPQHVKAQCFE
eukprot:12933360-Prorocentrum_lima.AAC.1